MESEICIQGSCLKKDAKGDDTMPIIFIPENSEYNPLELEPYRSFNKKYEDTAGNVTGALIDGGDTNTIIVSSTGAGKTRRVLCQYILSCIYALQSFVVHDPKGEIYSFFCRLLKKMGFRTKVINLRDPMKGDRLNFLQEAAILWKEGKRGRTLEVARGIAQTLYSPLEDKNDLFWTQTSINLFLCYFTIAATIYEPDYVTLSTIYRIHIEGIEKSRNTWEFSHIWKNIKMNRAMSLEFRPLRHQMIQDSRFFRFSPMV